MADKLTNYLSRLNPKITGSNTDNALPDLSNGFSIDSINRFIDLIGMEWEVASNMVTNGKVFRRSYKLLSEDKEQPPRIQEIDLGANNKALEGRYFYKVTHYFVEDTYSAQQPFYKWKRERLKFEQEVLYHNKITDELKWNRSIDKEIVIPDDNAYGNEKNARYIEYEDLNNEVKLPIKVNKCWGLEVESDGEFIIKYKGEQVFKGSKSHKLTPLLSTDIEIHLIETQNHTGTSSIKPITSSSTTNNINSNSNNNNNNDTDTVKSNIGQNKPSIEIPSPIKVSPTYLLCKLYGTKEPEPIPIGRKIMPLGEDIRYRETLIHPSNTDESDRYKPPIEGDFNYTFNNLIDKSQLPIVEDYENRIKGNSEWI